MKLNYALGIKKIIILWIVVFLGGYILNSFFEKINSLDEGLNAISHKIPPGFKVEYWNTKTTGSADRTYQNNDKTNILQTPDGIETPSKKKIRVSMVANNTPPPKPVPPPPPPSDPGCSGPKFTKTGKEILFPNYQYPMPTARVYDSPGVSWRAGVLRKLGKSECQMAKRGEECSGAIPMVSNIRPFGQQISSDNGVLPVVSYSKHGFGCIVVDAKNPESGNYPTKPQYRIVWNIGCKGSTSECGGRTGNSWNYGEIGRDNTRGIVHQGYSDTHKQNKTGAYLPGLPGNNYKNNDKSNWDKFNIPIEAGDGIPR